MTFFFLLVGTELKRELLEGHLSNIKRQLCPPMQPLAAW